MGTDAGNVRCSMAGAWHALAVTEPAYRTAAYRAAQAQLKANPDTACVYCGSIATTIDHAIPVALGGDDRDLVPACWRCNAKRGSALGHALKRKRRASMDRHPSSRFLGSQTQDPPAFRSSLPGGLPPDAPPSRVW